jgi:outer membrane lipoprotein carrier protein
MMKNFFKENKHLSVMTAAILIFNALFFIFAPQNTFAEAPAPIEEIVTSLQQTYENTTDFKADFSQETTVSSIKKTDSEGGIVFFKSPKYMLWNYIRPKSKKLVINLSKAWLYLPQEKVAYTQEADYIFQSKVLIKFLSGLGKLQDDFIIKYAEPKNQDKNGNYLLMLIPLDKKSSLTPFQITVDKSSFLILQISFEDVLGNSTLLRFSNISTNTGMSEKIFQFKPPAGVSIFKMP